MKKYLALLLTVLMLLPCLAGCSTPEDNSGEVAALQQEIDRLNARIAELELQIADLEAGAISEWELTGTPLTQGSGAAVSLRAVPANYREGQMALFRVLLESQTVAEQYCDWDGTAYTAGMELDAADGYSYLLIVIQPDGRQEYLDLNSPANPVDPMLVYLYSSLSTSCMLNVYDWQIANGTLTPLSGDVQIQLPRMTATGEKATCSAANLVLQLDGEELERKSLMLPVNGDLLETDVSGISFSVPELAESSQLDLWLEVLLSDGQVLTHSGSSWYYFEGELIQAVG